MEQTHATNNGDKAFQSPSRRAARPTTFGLPQNGENEATSSTRNEGVSEETQQEDVGAIGNEARLIELIDDEINRHNNADMGMPPTPEIFGSSLPPETLFDDGYDSDGQLGPFFDAVETELELVRDEEPLPTSLPPVLNEAFEITNNQIGSENDDYISTFTMNRRGIATPSTTTNATIPSTTTTPTNATIPSTTTTTTTSLLEDPVPLATVLNNNNIMNNIDNNNNNNINNIDNNNAPTPGRNAIVNQNNNDHVAIPPMPSLGDGGPLDGGCLNNNLLDQNGLKNNNLLDQNGDGGPLDGNGQKNNLLDQNPAANISNDEIDKLTGPKLKERLKELGITKGLSGLRVGDFKKKLKEVVVAVKDGTINDISTENIAGDGFPGGAYWKSLSEEGGTELVEDWNVAGSSYRPPTYPAHEHDPSVTDRPKKINYGLEIDRPPYVQWADVPKKENGKCVRNSRGDFVYEKK